VGTSDTQAEAEHEQRDAGQDGHASIIPKFELQLVPLAFRL
jgi:hypothetical protein